MGLDDLKSVFGPLRQNPPSARDGADGVGVVADFSVEDLPASPTLHKTGVVLVPTARFDGNDKDAPWSMPEAFLWNWLRTSPIEHIDERFQADGHGALIAYMRADASLRVVLLKFDTAFGDGEIERFGVEYALDPKAHARIRRQQAAYEVAKAAGCDDIVPPMAARVVNLVPLVSDAFRERVAIRLGIDPLLVDETFGTVALAVLLPLNAINLVEKLGMLGGDWPDRWASMSSSLRYSIYRQIYLDFVLGTPDRLLSDLLVNSANDSTVCMNLDVSLPDPVASADAYFARRAAGWGRKDPDLVDEVISGSPPEMVETISLVGKMGQPQVEGLSLTIAQMSKQMTPDVLAHLGKCMVEIGVSTPCIAAMVARILYAAVDPSVVGDGHAAFVRGVLAPLRRGYPIDSGPIADVVSSVDQMISTLTGEQFSLAGLMAS